MLEGMSYEPSGAEIGPLCMVPQAGLLLLLLLLLLG
jgi:hypothetical protein